MTKGMDSTYNEYYVECIVYIIGESYSGSIAVSKTVHGGSNPSSPVFSRVEKFMSILFFYCNLQKQIPVFMYEKGNPVYTISGKIF